MLWLLSAALGAQLQPGLNEGRGGRAPQQFVARVVDSRVRQRNTAVNFSRDYGVGVSRDQRVSTLERDRQPQEVARQSLDPDFEANLPSGKGVSVGVPAALAIRSA